jgi:hypothetical protein
LSGAAWEAARPNRYTGSPATPLPVNGGSGATSAGIPANHRHRQTAPHTRLPSDLSNSGNVGQGNTARLTLNPHHGGMPGQQAGAGYRAHHTRRLVPAASILPTPNHRPYRVTRIEAIDSGLQVLHLTPFRRRDRLRPFWKASSASRCAASFLLYSTATSSTLGQMAPLLDAVFLDQMVEQRANILNPVVKVHGLLMAARQPAYFMTCIGS